MIRRWACLTEDDKWGVWHKFMAIIWALAFILFTPSTLTGFLNRGVTVLIVCAIIAGALAGIYGRMSYKHLTWELPGLFAVVSGFLFYASIQGTLAGFGDIDRIALTVLALMVASQFLERLQFLVRRWWKVVFPKENRA